MRQISVSRFKAQCLGLLEEVSKTGEELLVTKRGRAIVRVVPIERPASLLGSVELVSVDDDLLSTHEDWHAVAR